MISEIDFELLPEIKEILDKELKNIDDKKISRKLKEKIKKKLKSKKIQGFFSGDIKDEKTLFEIIIELLLIISMIVDNKEIYNKALSLKKLSNV